MTTDIVELPPFPDTSLLVTQDDVPVDNIYVEKLQRLLTEPLYSSWTASEDRPFLALANVGLFFAYAKPPLVPDMMLSLDVPEVTNRREPENRSYFSWVIGKMPEVVVEIVSDRRGGEDTDKMQTYKRLHIPYYVIFDPGQCLEGGILRAFALTGGQYTPIDPSLFPSVGLGLKLWQGEYEKDSAVWLRWCDSEGSLIRTGRERADGEKARADSEKERADGEKERAELEMERAESEAQRAKAAEEKNLRLLERLRQLGEKVD